MDIFVTWISHWLVKFGRSARLWQYIAGTLGCVFIDNETYESGVTKCTTGETWSAFSRHHSSVFHCQWTHNQVFLLLSHMLSWNAKSIFIYVMKYVSGFIWKLGINLQFVSSRLTKLDETIGYCWCPIVMRWSLRLQQWSLWLHHCDVIHCNKQAVSQWLLTFNLCVSVTWPLTCAFHLPCTHTPEIIDMHRGVCDKTWNVYVFLCSQRVDNLAGALVFFVLSLNMIVNPDPSCRWLQTLREFGDIIVMRFDGVFATVYLIKYVSTFALLCFVEVKSSELLEFKFFNYLCFTWNFFYRWHFM